MRQQAAHHEVRETLLGRIGSVLIPRFDDQLYDDRRDLLAVLVDAGRLAHEIGARNGVTHGIAPLGQRLRPRPGQGAGRP